jgi:hypothetical protein
MTPRERFWKWANYESYDIPAWGDWLGPYQFWLEQGLPPAPEKYKQMEDGISQYFLDLFQQEGKYSAFWGTSRVPVNLGICPGYTEEVLSEDDTHEIIRMGDGVVGERLKNPNSTLIAVKYLSHPLTGPENWEQFKREQLDPHHPARYPDDADWEALKARWTPDRSHIITIDGGSFYGFVRNWMGVENASYAFCDEPEWMHEVMDYLADFFIEVLGRAVRELDIDIAMFWEDMCFKNGPLISPAMFREFLLEPYQRVTKFLGDNGVKLCFVDCDGNIDQLVGLWLEGGVRGFYPLEVASDMKAVKLLEKYQKDRILLWGNVDKRELAKGHDAIDAELARLAPAVAMGGFIPLVDHGVPEDIPYEHYCYYAKRRAELFGIKVL